MNSTHTHTTTEMGQKTRQQLAHLGTCNSIVSTAVKIERVPVITIRLPTKQNRTAAACWQRERRSGRERGGGKENERPLPVGLLAVCLPGSWPPILLQCSFCRPRVSQKETSDGWWFRYSERFSLFNGRCTPEY